MEKFNHFVEIIKNDTKKDPTIYNKIKDIHNVDYVVNDNKISSQLKRSLSIHHLDIKHEHLKIKEDPISFFHIKAGNVIERTGVYTCSRNYGDKYGQFFYCNERKLTKYNARNVAHYKFNINSLMVLQRKYLDLKLKLAANFLYCDINKAGYKEVNGKKRFEFIKSPNKKYNDFLIFPNIYRAKKNEHKENPYVLKNSMSGITLYAWAVHPSLDVIFIECENNEGRNKETKSLLESDSKLIDFKNRTGVKYLSTILDLDENDIEMLEKLKKDINNHLFKIYNVNPDIDKVRVFFHFPVNDVTATLHAHIHVNQGDAMLNYMKSYLLDDIICHLKNGKPIFSLVAERNNGDYYTTDKLNTESVIYPFKVGTVANPYILKPSLLPT